MKMSERFLELARQALEIARLMDFRGEKEKASIYRTNAGEWLNSAERYMAKGE